MFRAHHTPPLSVLLDDLPTRDSGAVAKHLGVTKRTLARWEAADEAPRAILLALFYESRWGFSVLDSTAHNGAMYTSGQVQGLERENAALRARIARLERIGRFGAANAPSMSAVAAPARVGLDVVTQLWQA